MEDKEKVLHTVAIFQPVYQTGLPGEMLLYLPDFERDRRVPVKRIPIVSSNCFKSATVEPGEPDDRERTIRFALDKHGIYVWMQAQRQFHGRELAVAVDGFFRFTFQVTPSESGPGTLAIRGPWQLLELENITSHAARNYRLLHPRIRD